MKWMPQSAFGRLTLLIAGVLAITVLAALVLFGRFAAEERLRVHKELLGQRAERILAALRSGGMPAVEVLIRDDLAESGIGLHRQPPADAVPARRIPRPIARALRHELPRRFGEDALVMLSPGPPASLWVQSALTERRWISFPLLRQRGNPPLRLVAWLGIIGLSVFAAAWLFARQFNRPLVELAEATHRLARGEPIANLKESGPREVRSLNHALQRASEQVQRSNQERELLLAGVSHDLRTPLARLRFAAELLDKPGGDAELQAGMVQDIEEMDAIIGQFLAYVREGQDEAVEDCNLNELVAEVVRGFQREGRTISASLTDLPVMALRPVAIQRLVSNLLSNALQHGQPPVRISTGADNDVAFIAVRDAGKGIPAAQREDAKRPFSRGNPARNSQGAGLGLAIVRRIARRHRGELSMRQDSQGFEVRVALPLR